MTTDEARPKKNNTLPEPPGFSQPPVTQGPERIGLLRRKPLYFLDTVRKKNYIFEKSPTNKSFGYYTTMEYARGFLCSFFPSLALTTAVILLSVPASSAKEAQPDTIAVTDISRDTAGNIPSGWENVLAKKQRMYTEYTVEYDNNGPYVRAVSRSAGSWIERPLRGIDIRRHAWLEWDWMVSSFPKVEWERNKGEDDFAIRVELVFDYRGNAFNPIYLMRKGLVTYLLRRNPPALVLSYVWAAEVPVDKDYQSPESLTTRVIPLESGIFTVRRWLTERRDIAADVRRAMPGDTNLVLKAIRIRCDADNSGSSAESGVRNIRFVVSPEKTGTND